MDEAELSYWLKSVFLDCYENLGFPLARSYGWDKYGMSSVVRRIAIKSNVIFEILVAI
jgi:hypothetical protein